MTAWRSLGAIVRLQIELDRLKESDDAPYRHELIRQVERLDVGPDGVLAPLGGGYVIDIHHAAHPLSRSNGTNHLSIGFSGHYDAMRERFGAHLELGIAGENVIVERPGLTALAELGEELLFELADGPALRVTRPRVMHPCAPFTRFCLQESEPAADRLKAGLQFLDDGMRGFKGIPAAGGVLLAGAMLHARD